MTDRPRLVLALTTAALLAVAACTSDAESGTDHGTGHGGGGSDLDLEAIVASTVRVRADGCGPRTELGTGTAIPDGLVVTAAHVVAGADQVVIVGRSGAAIATEVVLFDPDLDVAALRPSTDTGSPVLLRNDVGREGEVGVVAVISTDGTAEPVPVEVLQRVAIRTTDIYRDRPVERAGLRIDVSVEPGDSGAMVHLSGGGVGIVWSRSTTTPDQAWTVDLPSELRDATSRRTMIEPVDVGACL